MTVATINGIPINYQVKGDGDLVVLIMGTGSPGRVWICTRPRRWWPPATESAPSTTAESHRPARASAASRCPTWSQTPPD